MFIPLGIKTDYTLLSSLIKIPELINYLKDNNITACGILDDNLYGCINFYNSCLKNNIKPIIGLKLKLGDYIIYLYARNYQGFQNLLKINTIKEKGELNYINLRVYSKDIICVLPFKSRELYEKINSIYSLVYISYHDLNEKNNASLITDKVVYIGEIAVFTFDEIKYLPILREIATGEKCNIEDFEDNYLLEEVLEVDAKTTVEFSNLIDIKIPSNKRYIPHYDKEIEDSFKYLTALCIKGLNKRFNNDPKIEYKNRLNMELNTIMRMGYVDYFLIVYDYVKFAKKNGILVGPGRGSAAGSLVSFCLGITNVDPIKYDLLFERFLNPDRVTMPDIDIDFEATRRDEVIKYVKERYGSECVANIMSFGTLATRQVIRDVSKFLDVNPVLVDKFSNLLNPKKSLEENLKNKVVSDCIKENNILKKVYQVSLKLEGLKRHISTHAAGVVISSVPIDDVIPVCFNDGELLTGVTMEFLEDLGLLKMDFLALANLTIIKNVLQLIEEETKEKLDLFNIPLDDAETLALFKNVDTEGVFQFESTGMKNFIAKLKPSCFSDLVAALALFRPGPMNNIDSFIRRKNGIDKVTYPDDSLEDILKDTYGIMIYQEQIMQVLVRMGDYSFAEADNIRRAMSKKKYQVMEEEREKFTNKAFEKGFTKEKANEVYDLIIKFADYGFNKAHSVAYAMIAYQMAYLKAKYPVYFVANLLNMGIDRKKYIVEAKKKNIYVYKPNINMSTDMCVVKNNKLLLPLNIIHNLGAISVKDILEERNKNGKYSDYFEFVSRTYGRSVNRKTIECLIDADALRDFNLNHRTLMENLDSALDYAVLTTDLDESLVIKPNIVEYQEYSDAELMERELNIFGFYITNHPSSKYTDNVMKLTQIKKYFDKYVDCIVIINSIHKIKTKNNDTMAFITANDETDSAEFVIFPKKGELLNNISKNDFVKIRGQVTKRLDKYQIVVSNIEKM